MFKFYPPVAVGFLPPKAATGIVCIDGEIRFLKVVAPCFSFAFRKCFQEWVLRRCFARSGNIRACAELTHVIADEAQVCVFGSQYPQASFHFRVEGKQ